MARAYRTSSFRTLAGGRTFLRGCFCLNQRWSIWPRLAIVMVESKLTKCCQIVLWFCNMKSRSVLQVMYHQVDNFKWVYSGSLRVYCRSPFRRSWHQCFSEGDDLLLLKGLCNSSVILSIASMPSPTLIFEGAKSLHIPFETLTISGMGQKSAS